MTRAILLCLAALATACGEPPPRPTPGPGDLPFRGNRTIAPLPKPDVTLPDADGRPFDFQAETEGRIALLFFGYTFCPDICPIHMATLAAALAEMEPDVRSGIDVIFVSVDPERDTPERLGSWLATFDSTFVGLRGTPEQIEDALAFYRYPPPERSADGPVYTVGHPSLVYAYTPDGLSHVMYGPETPQAVWRHDLAMMAGYPWADAPSATSADPGAASDASGSDADPPAGPPLGAAGDVVVLDAFAPQPPPNSAAAVYLTLRNTGSRADTLVELSSPAAEGASLHDMVTVDGVVRMEAIAGVALTPGRTVRLAPGARHGMLQGVTPGSLVVGQAAEVTLRFARGGTVTVPLRVVRYQDLMGG
ncbi:MAG: SCO family protein [Longimicrobiales bacterium]